MTTLAPPIADPMPQAKTPPRRRILLSAFATTPYRGSEDGIGWNLAIHLARHHDLTVLAFKGFDDDSLHKYDHYVRENGPVPGLTMHWVEQPPLSRYLQREGGWHRAFYYHGYASWQRAALREARQLHAARPFDLVHHLTITGFREPGYLWKLDAPFFWGPVNGAQMMPWPFLKLLGPRDRLLCGVRNVLNRVHPWTKRRCHKAAAAASHIWALDDKNADMMLQRFGRQSERLLETGTHPASGQVPRSHAGARPLRLVWSGVHEGRKCLPILLHAMARLQNQNAGAVELVVLGTGSETGRWQRLASRLGLTDRIRWTGLVPLDQAQAEMDRGDAFVLTSLLEGTPNVIMEALSLGLPVLCHDACGMGEAITETCGLKVPLRDPDTSIAGFTHAIRSLLDHPAHLEPLSRGAMQRARELTWASNADRIAAAYDEVLSRAMP